MSVPSSFEAFSVEKKGELTRVTRQVRQVKPDEVLVKVEACGLCHSDCYAVLQAYPGVTCPCIPGHEVIGTVVAKGSSALRFNIGDRVGRGWSAGHCFSCNNCLHGKFILCENKQVTGITSDGGYGQYMYAPWQSLAPVPAKLDSKDAAPLMCAGLTVFNSLRQLKVPPPALVAVQGIGGLGHLGIQFANKLGYNVAAISSCPEKEGLARKLGAHHYIDASKGEPAKQLQQLGGAAVILCTAYDTASHSALFGGLKQDGILLALGGDMTSYSVSSTAFIAKQGQIRGWQSGSPIDAEETLEFAALHGIKPMLEVFPFGKVKEGYERMLTGKPKFRVVIDYSA